MINKFFPHGTGAGAGPINYLLGKNRDRENAHVLRGNLDLTEQLIDTAPGRHKYTSGVLSFAENISDEVADQVMDEYERWFTADGVADLNFLWVKHTDKGRTEIHFVIPNVELSSNRSFNPYIHKLDQYGIDALKDRINATYNFADPNDPERKRLISSAADYLKQSKDRKELIQTIDQHIAERAAEHVSTTGGTWTRDDTIQALQELGFEIARQTKKAISISHPELKKNIRLKGGFYEPDCRINAESATKIARDSEQYERDRQLRIEQATTKYEESLRRRRERIEQRYRNSRAFSQELENELIELERGRKSEQRHENSSVLSRASGGRAGHDPSADAQTVSARGDHFYRCDRVADAGGAGRSVSADGTLHKTGNTERAVSTKDGAGKIGHANQDARRNIRSDARGDEMLEKQKETASLSDHRVIEIEFLGRKLGEIVDYGNSLVAHGMSAKAAAYNIIKEAQGKGWRRIELDGSHDFLENAMTMALKRGGIEVVPKNKSQELMLERIRKEVEYDGVREDALRAIEAAKQASEQAERAGRSLEQSSKQLERQGREFDERAGRADEIKREVEAMADMELERFKAEIPIQQYLQDQGWTLDKKKSTKKTAVLTDGRSKFVVSRNENGHYVYFDVGTGKGGSIVDLVQDLTGKNLGQIRKELRGYIGGEIERHSSSPSPYKEHLEKSSKNEQEIERARMIMTEQYAQLKQLDDSYLRSRGVTISDDSRFSNVRSDDRGNTCFPHYINDGVVGWEKKNKGFTGYAEGGRKVGIYATTNFKTAQCVVIVESGIDAFSHAQLFQTDSSVAYVSIGGQLTDKQVELIKEITRGKHVIVATDNDETGFKYADKLKQELDSVSCQIPDFKDWNDDLLEQIEERKRERAATRSYDGFELGM